MAKRVHVATAFLMGFAASLGCGKTDTAADAAPQIDAIPNTGTVSLSWSITDGNSPLTCAQIGAVRLRGTAKPAGAAFGTTFSLDCSAGTATSQPFPADTYEIEIDLTAMTLESLLDAPVIVPGVEVMQSQDTTLDPLTFTVEPLSNITFAVDAGTVGGNCADEMSDGAGIVGFRFELQDGAGACIPTTFDVAGGSSWTNDCMTPAPAACIESDRLVTVTDAPSGPHTIVVKGIVAGDLECWTRTSQFTSPGHSLTTELGILSIDRDLMEPGCDSSMPDAGMM